MKKAKRIERVVLIAMVLSVASGTVTAATPGCWSDVYGDVVFDVPLTCYLNERPADKTAALKVVADGTTIDLAGQPLKCIDVEWNGQSCQGKVPDGQPSNATTIAIDLNGHTNVTIKGPGAIEWFDRSIVIDGVGKATVRNVAIGATQVYGTDRGPFTTGIRIANVGCPGAILVEGNEIADHRYGIVVESSSCVKIQGNYIHNNNAGGGESHGVLLSGSGNNTIANNLVKANGFSSSAVDGGITLTGAGSMGNRVAQNTVELNCGDGISTRDGAQGNPISGTYARQNPTGLPSCPAPGPPAYGLAERNFPGANTWRKNNDCDTGFQTPAGVCTTTTP